MPQQPTICGHSIHVCRIRATLLDDLGVVTAGDNSYVSDKPVVVQVTPVIRQGVDEELVTGCDQIAAAYRGRDKLKRFDFQIDLAALEPALLSLMLGATLIEDASDVPVPIGVWWPNQISTDGADSPNVAFEFWTDVWEDDSQNPDWPYIHHVYGSTFWQIGQQRYENGFTRPVLNGFSRTNASWGAGPYGDQGESLPPDSPGGWFFTETAPPDSTGCTFDVVTT